MKKIMLIYPPGEIYQRGEDRCQINVQASVANSLRACNDLGYISSALKQMDYMVFLRDYPAENLSFSNLEDDINKECPDVIFISTTNGSIFNDIDIIKSIKKIKKDIVFILKSALFFNADKKFLNSLDLKNVDYLIGTESEFVAPLLIDVHFNDRHNVKELQGISYKKDGMWVTNELTNYIEDLDSLHYPDRHLMKNELYINPDTNRPIATIITSKGCPFSCIYCLSPQISGFKVRYRTVESVFEEMKECIEKFKITDFFFKADTFTFNKEWVLNLCNLIIDSKLKGKINWVANSRANTLDDEIISKMKEAGCSMIAIGLESGSDESLEKMKKGTTVMDNRKAVELIKKHGLKIFGFYMIGFPWETKEHIEQTKKLIFELDTDFIEISIVTPFIGTKLYEMTKEKFENSITGCDSFKNIISISDNFSNEELINIRKNMILKYHIRPSFILKKLLNQNLTPAIFLNYLKYGLRLLKNYFSK